MRLIYHLKRYVPKILLSCLFLNHVCLDVDTCAENHCLVIPLVTWAGLNAVIVLVGSVLTAVFEVSIVKPHILGRLVLVYLNT